MDHTILTRNLVDPTKKREDTVDSLKNAFGFGFDMGDGMIETADGARKTRARTNLLPDRVLNDRWKVTIRPEGRVKSRLEVDREEREVEGGEAAKSNVRS